MRYDRSYPAIVDLLNNVVTELDRNDFKLMPIAFREVILLNKGRQSPDNMFDLRFTANCLSYM